MRNIVLIHVWMLSLTTCLCAQTAVNKQPQADATYSKDNNHSLFLDQKQSVGFLKSKFVVEPELFIHHTAERAFIGPGSFLLDNGDILMAAPWGRPPTNFEQLAAKFPVPIFYRSKDGGRTWNEQGRMKMTWNLPGMISDGGISFLRLKDGRLAFLAHRNTKDLKGGGLPIISFSEDDGKNWTPAKLVGEPEGIWYVMNDRLIQLGNGRLIVPVSHMPQGMGKSEGDHCLGLCFFSDDGGETWKKSQKPADLNDGRGMAEPTVAEIGNNQLIMLARTGSGSVFCSRSNDGGDTWSIPTSTTLISACSSLTLKTLPDGRLIVFYNHAKPIKQGAFFPRTPLVYAVSEDKGMTWGEPVIIDDSGVEKKDRQNIYPTVCFTKEGMLVMWSNHGADPGGSFAGQYDANIGGGKRAILAYPKVKTSRQKRKNKNITKVLRIMPLGDSYTRGSYLIKKEEQVIGLANPDGGGYRKPLQDKLRAAGIAFDFVGDLDYNAFGKDGDVDPEFDPDHQGLAGFGNYGILHGGLVPTPKDVLAEKKLEQIIVPGIVEVLKKHNPDIILLMSGANGFDAKARDELIRTIGENSKAHLIVATILPQKAPRNGWEKVDNYNASLQSVVDALQKVGKQISLVDMNAVISADNLMPDGVHPDKFAMGKMADVWFTGVLQQLNSSRSLRSKSYKIKKQA
jgi:hypothetical protein